MCECKTCKNLYNANIIYHVIKEDDASTGIIYTTDVRKKAEAVKAKNKGTIIVKSRRPKT